MPSQDLRVAVVGAGLMGTDHVERIAYRTVCAEVSAVVDIDAERASAAARFAEGAQVFTSVDQLLEAQVADAVVLATPGFLHEEALLKILEARLPVMCEKPLTPDAESALRVLEAEKAAGKKLIHVGFMRRFDAGYRRLKSIIDSGEYGQLLMLHHQHRNAAAPESFTDEMLIHDSVVHEFDAVRFFSGEEIVNVQVRSGRRSSLATKLVRDPQHVTVQTASGLLADVEIFVNAQLGYQVHTQASFEKGVVKIGDSGGYEITAEQSTGRRIDQTFHTRFVDAYDQEIQKWVDDLHAGRVTGPDAWDGYAAAAVCAAGVKAQEEGGIVEVELAERPSFYG